MFARFALPTGLIFGAFLLAAPALAADPRPATMSLQGTATVKAEPDIADVSTGVITSGKSAAEALKSNNAAMADLLAIAKSAGIVDRDVQTSNFSVQPQYTYSDQRDASGNRLPPQIVGYQVSNTLEIRVRDLTRLGKVLDQMVSAGSNNIGGISFDVADSSTLVNTARRDAMADALAKARLYADAAGVCLDRIVSISEAGGMLPQLKMTRQYDTAMAAESVPVATGEVSYSMNVAVEWEFSPGPCAKS